MSYLKVKGYCTRICYAVLSKPPMSQLVLLFAIDTNISFIVFMDNSSFFHKKEVLYIECL